jgi:hypothetical protein
MPIQPLNYLQILKEKLAAHIAAVKAHIALHNLAQRLVRLCGIAIRATNLLNILSAIKK